MSTKTITEKYENGKLVERITMEKTDTLSSETPDGLFWRYSLIERKWYAAGWSAPGFDPAKYLGKCVGGIYKEPYPPYTISNLGVA